MHPLRFKYVLLKRSLKRKFNLLFDRIFFTPDALAQIKRLEAYDREAAWYSYLRAYYGTKAMTAYLNIRVLQNSGYQMKSCSEIMSIDIS